MIGLIALILSIIAAINVNLVWLFVAFIALIELYGLITGYIVKAPELSEKGESMLSADEKMAWRRYSTFIRYPMASRGLSKSLATIQLASVLLGIVLIIRGEYVWGVLLLPNWLFAGMIAVKFNPQLYLHDKARKGDVKASLELEAVTSTIEKIHNIGVHKQESAPGTNNEQKPSLNAQSRSSAQEDFSIEKSSRTISLIVQHSAAKVASKLDGVRGKRPDSMLDMQSAHIKIAAVLNYALVPQVAQSNLPKDDKKQLISEIKNGIIRWIDVLDNNYTEPELKELYNSVYTDCIKLSSIEEAVNTHIFNMSSGDRVEVMAIVNDAINRVTATVDRELGKV